MIDPQLVSVILPTKALRARGDVLWRAIESVTSQGGVRAVPLVVVNGQEADPDIVNGLRNDPRIRLMRVKEASLPGALRAGRSAVDTPWFSEVDDDDVLLPGALALRVRTLSDKPEFHAVVTNGFRRDNDKDVLHVPRMEEIERGPLRALIRGNWLLPGSWLCRTEAVDGSLFAGMPDYSECTYMAILFATRFRTLFLPEPTVAWYTDTPASESKSTEYVLSGPGGLERILELNLPDEIRYAFQRKMANALHEVAEVHHRAGLRRKAWEAHVASMRWPGGGRFGLFTLKLLLGPGRSGVYEPRPGPEGL